MVKQYFQEGVVRFWGKQAVVCRIYRVPLLDFSQGLPRASFITARNTHPGSGQGPIAGKLPPGPDKQTPIAHQSRVKSRSGISIFPVFC